MKKRFVTTLISLIACIACLVGLVACGDGNAESVAGNTYAFEKVEITKGVSGAIKEESEAMLNYTYEGSEISFEEDGSFSWVIMQTPLNGSYKQSGSKLTLTNANSELTAKITDDGIQITMENQGVKAILTFHLVVDETEDDQGDQGGQDPGTDDLAGKTYVFTDYLMGGQSILDMVDESFKSYTIVFHKNNEYTITLAMTSQGTYTVTDNTVTLNPNVQGGSPPVTLTVSGNTLTWLVDEEENMIVVFTAQS